MNSIIRHGKIIDCCIIAMLWLVAIWVVYPLGDFPLNDDWAYATDVKNLLETGVFNPVGWTSMSLFSHVLWGALWCGIFGFSFEVLRISTLAISLICLWNVYLIGREMGASRLLALIVALTPAFNPIYFSLSFTFMTEVSFMAFVSFAALFFVRFLKNNSSVDWWLAIAFCIIATLSRQTGLFLSLAFLFIFFLALPPAAKGESIHKLKRGGGSPLGVRGAHGQKLATHLLAATLPFILSFAALKLFESHMFSTGKIQALYGLQVDELKYLLLNTPEILPIRVLRNIYQMSLYLGLMCLPVWVFLAWGVVLRTDDFPELSYGTGSRRGTPNYLTAKVVSTVLFPILFLIAVIINGSQMPTLVGILEVSGVGPRTLHDAYFLQISTDELPRFFWKILTYLGALGAGLIWALLVCGFLFSLKKEKNNTLGIFGSIRRTLLKCQTKGAFSRLTFPKCPTSMLAGLFFLLSAAIYFTPFALVGFYDRYLLPLMMVVPLGVVGLLARFHPLNPPPKGETIHIPLASPPLEGTSTSSPPLEGTSTSSPLLDGTSTSSPPLDGTSTSSPPLEGTSTSSPPLEGTSTSSPPLDGTSTSSPPLDGTSTSSPPLEGAGGWKTLATSTAFSLIILMTIFSITATHDYLAWNRARWQALHDLTVKENIPTTQIDGGFEFGGWYNFHEIEVEMDTQKSWWWVTEDEYILTFSEITGYDIYAEYTYHSWWWGERRIFVLQRRP